MAKPTKSEIKKWLQVIDPGLKEIYRSYAVVGILADSPHDDSAVAVGYFVAEEEDFEALVAAAASETARFQKKCLRPRSPKKA
jgi:hypothetical protein